MVGNLESEWLEVSALNLFRPTASSFSERRHFHVTTQAHGGEEGGTGPLGKHLHEKVDHHRG